MGADGKREFRISPLAQGDLEDIWSFNVETWTWEQAGKYHSDLLRTFAQLAGGDVRGREVDVRRGYRKYPVGSHFVFYRPRSYGIEIIRILHRRMDVVRHL